MILYFKTIGGFLSVFSGASEGGWLLKFFFDFVSNFIEKSKIFLIQYHNSKVITGKNFENHQGTYKKD
jgi:hypothetical protein